jgi:hypothetical protein
MRGSHLRWYLSALAILCGASGALMAGWRFGRDELAPTHRSLLWSTGVNTNLSDHDLTNASALSSDLAIIGKLYKADVVGPSELIAFDTKTGARRWKLDEGGWLLHPPHATDPLYIVPTDGAELSVLTQIDPAIGARMSSTSIPMISELGGRVAWSPDGPLELSDGTLRALDWNGQSRWAGRIDRCSSSLAPVVIGHRVLVPGDTLRLFALADGAVIASYPGDCYSPVVAPNGRHVFAHDNGKAHELDSELHVVREIPGTVLAASDTHYAVRSPRTAEEATRPVLVYAYGESEPVVVLSPLGVDDYFDAIALDGNTVFYFHAADSTFCKRDLATGRVDIIDHIYGMPVIAPDAAGVAPGVIASSPIIARPYALALDLWGVHAYFIGD